MQLGGRFYAYIIVQNLSGLPLAVEKLRLGSFLPEIDDAETRLSGPTGNQNAYTGEVAYGINRERNVEHFFG